MLVKLIIRVLLSLGVVLVFLRGNWVFIWIIIECITLCLILLIRKDNKKVRNLEAVSKYFLIQAIARFLLIFGVVFRYYYNSTILLLGEYNQVSYTVILVGLLIKLGAFPNPYWFVDIVKGVRYSRLGFVLVISKIRPLYLLFCVLKKEVFVLTRVIGIITALVGRVMGINQSNFRKVVAFSSVANLGWFILCIPLMRGGLLIFCFLGYRVRILPALWVAGRLRLYSLRKSSRIFYTLGEKVVLVFCLLSLGGFPPFVGFFVKWAFFQRLVKEATYIYSVLLVVRSLLSLFFYLYCRFNLVSFSSLRYKGASLISSRVNNKIVGFLIGGSTVLFRSVLVFLGLIW